MDMIRFDNPEYFYLLGLIPLFILLFFISQLMRKKALKKFGQKHLLPIVSPLLSFSRPWVKFILSLLAFSFMILALVNPETGSKLQEAKQEGVELIVALDVSKSMLAEDVKPNRLERSKMAVSRLIDNLGNDRVGVVIFGGNAVTQVPVTSDHSAAKMMLRTINTSSIPVQGTSLSAAIHRAVASFPGDDLTNKILIILSDGENHEDDPVQAASLAAEKGLRIHTVGIGTSEGSPVPVYQNNKMAGFLRDKQGKTVVSRFDEQTLRSIANVGKGIFTHGMGSDLGLDRVLEEINQTEKGEFEKRLFSEYESRYHYFVALALILLVLEIFIAERKNKWFEKIKLF